MKQRKRKFISFCLVKLNGWNGLLWPALQSINKVDWINGQLVIGFVARPYSISSPSISLLSFFNKSTLFIPFHFFFSLNWRKKGKQAGMESIIELTKWNGCAAERPPAYNPPIQPLQEKKQIQSISPFKESWLMDCFSFPFAKREKKKTPFQQFNQFQSRAAGEWNCIVAEWLAALPLGAPFIPLPTAHFINNFNSFIIDFIGPLTLHSLPFFAFSYIHSTQLSFSRRLLSLAEPLALQRP